MTTPDDGALSTRSVEPKPRPWGAIRGRGRRYYVRFTAEDREYERGPYSTWNAADKMRRRARALLEGGTPVADVLSACFGDFLGADLTFRKAAELYLPFARGKKRPSTFRADVSRLKVACKASWAGKVLGRVVPGDLIAWTKERQTETEWVRLRKRRPDETPEAFRDAKDRKETVKAPGASPSTLNRDLAIVSAVYKWARVLHYVDSNPVREARTAGGFSEKGRERTVYLTAEESRALIDAARGPVQAFLLAALHTGMRRGELLALRWRAVDLARKEVHVEAATEKAGRGRTVPLTDALHAELVRLKVERPRPALDGSDQVFTGTDGLPLTVGDVRVGFACAVEAADLPREKSSALVLHSLRHTAASLMVAAGVPLLDVARILGHSTLAVTMRYSHFAPKSGRSAIDRLGAALSGPKKALRRGGTSGV